MWLWNAECDVTVPDWKQSVGSVCKYMWHLSYTNIGSYNKSASLTLRRTGASPEFGTIYLAWTIQQTLPAHLTLPVYFSTRLCCPVTSALVWLAQSSGKSTLSKKAICLLGPEKLSRLSLPPMSRVCLSWDLVLINMSVCLSVPSILARAVTAF